MKHLILIGCLLFVETVLAQETVGDIRLPDGFQRISQTGQSFGEYLRSLELKEKRTVYLYNGEPKAYQGAQHAVINMDVGSRDLQQCADAVMRLRGEYLFGAGKADEIHFNFTNGDRVDFSYYAQGYRPKVNGNNISWSKTASASQSYNSFRKYMDLVFIYAGSYSLERELTPVSSIQNILPGDVFIQGGFPGHAIIVLDVAENNSGEKIFLLAQSYMPAQDIHVLRNPSNSGLSPWYSIDASGKLNTPEWNFTHSDLKRFR